MFNAGKSQGARVAKRSESFDGAVTILTSGCHFAGKLFCKGSTRIGGTIEGEIVSEGVLIIEQNAVIKAKITAEEVIVHGLFEGSLVAQRRLELCQTAKVMGDIETSCLTIREGAIFSGRSIMDSTLIESDFDQIDNISSPKLASTIGAVGASGQPGDSHEVTIM